MAEVQSSTQSGEMTRRFTEFVLMQAQQIALMLGHIPGPDGKPMEPNLPVARIFIDQLEMIREKTRGNLTEEESALLAKVLSELQLAFVEAGNAAPAPAPEKPVAVDETTTAKTDDDGKKKFTKSYG
ncbi:MAG: DUF1844 domain-containing protein [Chthoniobacterales bacterium]|nr:DUF1844 domain-containing protein [Chthoniobacterales bacterium]